MASNNKYAMLIECDLGTTLGGSCYRDVKNMGNHLVERCGFSNENIYILTTKVVKECIEGAKYGRSQTDIFKIANEISQKNPTQVVVLISGHGFSILDKNGDETDGKDEAIKIGNGYLTDDQLYEGIVKKINCNLILLSDTCHSGTLFDLTYKYDDHSHQLIKNTKRDANDMETSSTVISLSACNDAQLSMCDVGDDTGFGGSLTTAVLNIPNVLEDLIECKNVVNVYDKIKNSLKLLGQNVVLSALSLSF